MATGLVGPDGAALPLRLAGEAAAVAGTRVLILDQRSRSFTFEDTPPGTVPSLLRGFSAPVRLSGLSQDALRHLAAHDSDPFVRWDSGQQYATAVILDMVAAHQAGAALSLDPGLLDIARAALADTAADPAFAATVLTLPSTATSPTWRGSRITRRRITCGSSCAGRSARRSPGRCARPMTRWPNPARTGMTAPRSGGGRCATPASAPSPPRAPRAWRWPRAQFEARANMTDVLAALAVLAGIDCPGAAAGARCVLCRVARRRPGAGQVVRHQRHGRAARRNRPGPRAEHPSGFRPAQPEPGALADRRLRQRQPGLFHDISGDGYRFLTDAILRLDPVNSQVAARLTIPLGAWSRQDARRQVLMRGELARILSAPGLSGATREVAERSAG